MYRQLNYGKLALVPVLLTAAFVSCNHNKDLNVSSPAYYIEQSEKLFIPAAIQLPENLPAGNSRVPTYYATGVQKYKALQKAGDPSSFEWVLTGPQADLFDASNAKVGTHSAGPNWTISAYDSLFAQHFTPARTTASPDGTRHVDWLLLMPKAGKAPTGIFANVAYIQRIATTGGKAPATLPTHAGETADVNYTAVYRFTKKN